MTPLSRRTRRRWAGVLYVVAMVCFAGGAVLIWSGLHPSPPPASKPSVNGALADGGVPSATKLTPKAVQTYQVAPDAPKYLDIVKLHIHTRILSMGTEKNGALQVPWNIYDTGWYSRSAKPGELSAMLVDGHSGIGKVQGVFWNLMTLQPGDTIIITRGDGKQLSYAVAKVQTVQVQKVDMANMMTSLDSTRPGLNLITCAGDRIPGTNELNERVEVYAVL